MPRLANCLLCLTACGLLACALPAGAATWKPLANNLPPESPVHVIRESSKNKELPWIDSITHVRTGEKEEIELRLNSN